MSNLWVMAVRVSGRRRRKGLPAWARERGDFGFEFLDAGFESGRVGAGGLVAAFVGALGVERLGALGAVAIDGDAFEAHLPGLHVGVADVLDGAVVGHVDGLGDGAADEGLGGGHHLQVGQVLDAALAAVGLEGAIEDRQVLRLQAAGERSAPLSSTSSMVSNFSMCAMMRSMSCAAVAQAAQALRARCG